MFWLKCVPEISDALDAPNCESLKLPRFPWTTVNISVSLWNLHSTQQQGGCALRCNPLVYFQPLHHYKPGVGVQVYMNMDGRFQASAVSKNQQVRTLASPERISTCSHEYLILFHQINSENFHLVKETCCFSSHYTGKSPWRISCSLQSNTEWVLPSWGCLFCMCLSLFSSEKDRQDGYHRSLYLFFFVRDLCLHCFSLLTTPHRSRPQDICHKSRVRRCFAFHLRDIGRVLMLSLIQLVQSLPF